MLVCKSLVILNITEFLLKENFIFIEFEKYFRRGQGVKQEIDALEQARRQPPDIALVDIGLHGSDTGIEIAARLRSEMARIVPSSRPGGSESDSTSVVKPWR